MCRILPDPSITESINKTGYPDGIVIAIATARGMNVISIDEFDEITKIWETDADNDLIWLRLNYIMRDSVNVTSYTIDI